MNNKKVVLKRIGIKNWMGINRIVEVDEDVTLLSGGNGCGKTSFVDAMSTMLFGATEQDFNKAADGKSKRTIRGAVHNQLKYGGYAHEGASISYIILEFFDQINSISFLQGIQIKSKGPNSTSEIQPKYFRGLNLTLNDIKFDKILKTNNIDECDLLGRKGDSRLQYITQTKKAIFNTFFNKRNMKVADFEKYKKDMNRVLSAKLTNANGKYIDPDQFVKEYIFPEIENDGAKDVLEKVRFNQNDLKDKKEAVEIIKEKIRILKRIVTNLSKHIDCDDELEKLNIARVVFDVQRTENELRRNEEKLEKCKSEKETLDIDIEQCKKEIEEVDEDIQKLNVSIATDKTQEIIVNLENKQKNIERDISLLKSEYDKVLAAFNELVKINKEYDFGVEIEEDNLKKSTLICKEQVENLIEKLNNEISELSNERRDYVKIAAEKKEELSKLRSGIIENNNTRKYNEFKNALNNKFAQNGIDDKAYMLYEAIDVVDNEWQKVIEAFLGENRFLVLVKPENLTYALNLAKGKGVCIAKVNNILTSDSQNAANKVHVKKEFALARGVVNSLLNRVSLCDTVEELKESKTGIMRDGRVSLPGKYKTYNLEKINLVCGKEAIKNEINKIESKLVELNSLIKDLERIKEDREAKRKRASYNRDKVIRFDSLNYNAKENLQLKVDERNKILDELQKILNSEENERIRLICERLSNVKARKLALEKIKEKTQIRIGEVLGDIARVNQNIKNANDNLSKYNEIVKEKGYSEDVVNEAKAYLTEKKLNHSNELIERIEVLNKEKINATNHLVNYKNDYLKYDSMYNLQYTEAHLCELQKKLDNYNKVDIKNAQKAIDDTCERLNACKDGFFNALYRDLNRAKSEIKRFNETLKGVKFKNDTISIKVEGTNDKKFKYLYEQIMNYCDEDATKADKDKADIELSRLFSNMRDSKTEEFECYANYKNYLSATIHLKVNVDGEIKTRTLASDMDAGSGGQNQTPYFILLAMSLMRSYKDNGLRIIVLDEAFFKMDTERIDAILQLYKELNLQVIMGSCRGEYDSLEHVNLTHQFARDDLTGMSLIISTKYNKTTGKVEEVNENGKGNPRKIA